MLKKIVKCIYLLFSKRIYLNMLKKIVKLYNIIKLLVLGLLNLNLLRVII